MSAAGEIVRLPSDVIAGVDELVGADERDGFVQRAVARAVQSEVNRREMLKMFREQSPIWKEENHPELADGIAEYVHRMRRGEGEILGGGKSAVVETPVKAEIEEIAEVGQRSL